MSALPFALRRPWLLVRDLVVDRDEPDLHALGKVEDPEGFVWAILPHAARTFSACIALLPAASARAAAVAYLYCRILDTYEDLTPGVDAQVAALEAFGARFDDEQSDGGLPPAQPLGDALARDSRDHAHLLLVARCDRVDRVYAALPAPARALIRDVVQDMAAGMAWGARTFAEQGQVLEGDQQLLAYCRHVLGNPVVFAARLARLHHTGDATLTDTERTACMESGEFIQLANVTRDVEKDLSRGVAFHVGLRDDLGCSVPRPDRHGHVPRREEHDEPLLERVRAVREALLLLALRRSGAYRSLVRILDHSRLSLTRASGVLMLLFTDRYYRGCAEQVGRTPWGPRTSGLGLILRTLPTIVSRRWTERLVDTTVRRLLEAADATAPRL